MACAGQYQRNTLLQVFEEGEAALASPPGAQATQDRDGDRSNGRMVQGEEGLGTRPLASALALAAQGLEPHLAVWLCQQADPSPLRFSQLLTD
jgi:hypothetical protein